MAMSLPGNPVRRWQRWSLVILGGLLCTGAVSGILVSLHKQGPTTSAPPASPLQSLGLSGAAGYSRTNNYDDSGYGAVAPSILPILDSRSLSPIRDCYQR